MQRMSDRDYFDQLKLAFDIFGTYRDNIVGYNIFPVPCTSLVSCNNFASTSCCISIELNTRMSEALEQQLIKFGWNGFEEGYLWELRV